MPNDDTEAESGEGVVELQRFTPLYLRTNTPKGRGVFTSAPIPKGTTIETCPALLLSPEENTAHIEHTSLYHYTYNWPLPAGGKGKTQAVILGLGSMFNHSTHHQNVVWTRDLVNLVVVYRAARDIETDEELCISYGDHLTFVDADRGVESEEEEMGLERIVL
ncbi:hypothetical protein LTR62_005602 [Meristemomyces frigidus]|uniref:SET domain-containing protein n=1 Tax=Meristemomyces frigidus TaxID=1508187 RepID=A0AAN7YF52_9PEZI|nr:hypothetical protein LTR62_005602 [Meristemomyces frigidus]